MIIQIKTYHRLTGDRKSYFFNRIGEAEVFKLGDTAFDINAEPVKLSPHELVRTDVILTVSNH